MSTFAATIQRTPSFLAFDGTSSGASEYASRIPSKYSEFVSKFVRSATGNQRIAEPSQAILEVYRHCVREDWNGEGAEPVAKDAALRASRLLPTLPSYLPVPDIFADPTGAIAFEWYRRPRHRFVISIYGNGTIEYAGILGSENEVYGTAYHSEGLPKIVNDHLRQLFSD